MAVSTGAFTIGFFSLGVVYLPVSRLENSGFSDSLESNGCSDCFHGRKCRRNPQIASKFIEFLDFFERIFASLRQVHVLKTAY